MPAPLATYEKPGQRACRDDEALVLPTHANDPVVWRCHRTDGVEELAVFVGRREALREGTLPIAGRHERDGHELVFTPAFGFAAGQDYVVRTRRMGGADLLTEFTIPAETTRAKALVTAIYPSGSVLPENVLRFYVHFSVPMAPHRASDFIRLRDASGVADDAAFMKFKQELWNEDRTRLTVLIDPGRIKRSVATNLDLGPALLEGKHYVLTVDEGWSSADGSSVLPAHAKRFVVTEPLRTRPDVGLWTWTSPRPGTREPLKIGFDRPFDRYLLAKSIRIATLDGRFVGGSAHVGEDEACWWFVPDEPWVTGDVRVIVDEALEDVAGNNFRELLDHEPP